MPGFRKRIVFYAALVLLSACAQTPPTPTPTLTEAFEEIAGDFKQLHPQTRVLLSFGGSSQLGIQLTNGARADVFASADQDQMDLVDRGHDLVGRSSCSRAID